MLNVLEHCGYDATQTLEQFVELTQFSQADLDSFNAYVSQEIVLIEATKPVQCLYWHVSDRTHSEKTIAKRMRQIIKSKVNV